MKKADYVKEFLGLKCTQTFQKTLLSYAYQYATHVRKVSRAQSLNSSPVVY